MPAQQLVIVPHTHWDREWYLAHEEFRYRLVAVLDRLLDLLESDPEFRHFTLDGQTIVLSDYLAVRPRARERIAALVRAGRLLIGPWYVLPDEWLVSGEALIRNLRIGLRQAAGFGGGMRVGYVPDQFGHVGQLPQLFAGFGFDAAVLWRGVGADVERTLFAWQAPDGTELFGVYLLQGYGNAAHLPLEPVALAERLVACAQGLAASSPVPSLLLMNGSDHLSPQAGLPAALAAAAPHLGDRGVEIGSLPGFVARARREAPGGLPVHRGELRSGLRAPLLPGCASARLPQKQADFRNDRLLTRYLEPLAAWLGRLGGDADAEMIDHAWRIALENHPHDSICGCSIDAVHDEMDVRFARVEQVARAHLARIARELGRRVALPAADAAPAAGAGLLAWNPHGGGRCLLEGELELDVAERSRPPRLHLQRADGRRVAVRCDVREPSATLSEFRLPAHVVARLVAGFPEEFTGLTACGLTLRRASAGLELDVLLASRPPIAHDFVRERDRMVERLAAEGAAPVRYRARKLPRVCIRAVDDLPGHGLRAYRVARGSAGAPGTLEAARLPGGGVRLANASWRVELSPSGRVCLAHAESGTRIDDALRIASEGDRGDEYNFDPVAGADVVDRPERVRVRLLAGSGVDVSAEIDARYRVPVGLAPGRAARAARRVVLPVRIRLRLFEGLDRLDVEVELSNTAEDHRLRLHLAAPFAAEVFEVESAFEVAQRPIAPDAGAFGPRPAELPIGACPQRGFATLSAGPLAMSVASRGNAEVEALPAGEARSELALTLLRAVGWLSRGDLALRPGHAGPALPTPGAQVPGAHRAELSLRLHATGDSSRVLEAHRFGAPALLFAGGVAAGPLHDGARLVEIDDPRVVVSALEPRAGGGLGVRLWNASPAARRVRVGCAGAAGLAALDLAGEPAPAPRLEPGADGSVRLDLRPWQIVTLGTLDRV